MAEQLSSKFILIELLHIVTFFHLEICDRSYLSDCRYSVSQPEK